LFLISACSQQPAEQQAANTTAEPAAQTAQQQAQPATADPHAGLTMPVAQTQARSPSNAPTGSAQPAMIGMGRGKAVSVEHAGGYSYVEVEASGKRMWLAGNRSDVQVGDNVRWRDGAIMRNFHSKALQRDFPELMFVSQLTKDVPASPSEGKVVSVSNAAGYCYLEVDTGKGNVWLAAPEKPVNVGDSVRWVGGSAMRDFHSKSLERDFDVILFVAAVDVI
jgi:hypothetical protein